MHRILVVRTDRMGDVILSTPVLSAIKAHFPNSYITMLVRKYTYELVDGHPHLDDIICLEDIDSLPFLSQIRTIRQYNFDHAFILHPRFRLASLLAAAKIPIRVGSGYRWYSFLFNRRIFEHRKTAEHHELDYNLRMLQTINIPVPETVDFHFHIPQSAHHDMELLLQQFKVKADEKCVMIHPGSGGSARDWPLQRFAELIDRLSAIPKIRLIITGGLDERELTNELLNKTQSKPINLAGKLTIKQLAALIKRSRLFIANSTGPLHLAVAVGTEVVSFFCPIIPCLPERWGPYNRIHDSVLMPPVNIRCNKCTIEKCAHFDCMDKITVDSAYNMAIKKLAMEK
ncbi:glycosyltransferase family 9 protein [candidate division KSB1 bacterium]|nr:glycosyltransferase family 9 protein [candidate division KSB1 bacterium]